MARIRLPEAFRLGLHCPGRLPSEPWTDAPRLAELAEPSVRFRIDWGAVQPRGRGAADAPALDALRRQVETWLETGVRPLPILHGGALPSALGFRGWPDRDLVGRFADYAARVARRLGDLCCDWVLFEDVLGAVADDTRAGPPALPERRGPEAFLRGMHVANLAQAEAGRALRAERSGLGIGLSLRMGPIDPVDDTQTDADAAARWSDFAHRMTLDPVRRGRYPDPFMEGPAARRLGLLDDDLERVQLPVDFLDLELRPLRRVRAVSDDALGLDAFPEPVDVEVRGDPERRAAGLAAVLDELAKNDGDLPVELSVSGLGPGEPTRGPGDWISFHRIHLAEVAAAVEAGRPLRAYHADPPPTPADDEPLPPPGAPDPWRWWAEVGAERGFPS